MIVISMDSHTELVAKLKPFLARKWHAEFDTGEVLAERYFSKIIDAFSALTHDRTNLGEVGFTTVPDSGRRGGFEEYVRPLPIKERLAMIDGDGVAAEFITPFIFCMNAAWPTIAILRITCQPRRFVSPVPQWQTSSAAWTRCWRK
jgi:hypothetical protein